MYTFVFIWGITQKFYMRGKMEKEKYLKGNRDTHTFVCMRGKKEKMF